MLHLQQQIFSQKSKTLDKTFKRNPSINFNLLVSGSHYAGEKSVSKTLQVVSAFL